MMKHEPKSCPRCNTRFECKVGSIMLCQCSAVPLNESEIAYMKEKYADCLCASCMKILKTEYQNQLYKQKLKAILGVYYKDKKPDL